MTNAQQATDTLSARQQAIPLIAAFMAASDMPKLNAALNQGLDAGLSISEAKEILVPLYAYVGFPRSLNALGELLKVVDARKQRGIEDAPGREPSRTIPTGDQLLAVGTANQTKISGAPVKNAVTDFAPVINQFLQTHLFGDIFERDNLDWQSRELATVGALAATPGAEPQLRSHMAASMRTPAPRPRRAMATPTAVRFPIDFPHPCRRRRPAGPVSPAPARIGEGKPGIEWGGGKPDRS